MSTILLRQNPVTTQVHFCTRVAVVERDDSRRYDRFELLTRSIDMPPEVPSEDIRTAVKTIELGLQNKDIESPFDHIQKELIDPHKSGDPAYELKFNQKLDAELEKSGVLPKIMLEYAESMFPKFGSCRTFGNPNDTDNFLMHKFEFKQMGGHDTVYRLNPSTNSIWTLNDRLTPSFTPNSVDRMMLQNFYERFDQINKGYSSFHRGGSWLGNKIFTGSITVGDLRKWSAKESK